MGSWDKRFVVGREINILSENTPKSIILREENDRYSIIRSILGIPEENDFYQPEARDVEWFCSQGCQPCVGDTTPTTVPHSPNSWVDETSINQDGSMGTRRNCKLPLTPPELREVLTKPVRHDKSISETQLTPKCSDFSRKTIHLIRFV
jgi:hypothetical protein